MGPILGGDQTRCNFVPWQFFWGDFLSGDIMNILYTLYTIYIHMFWMVAASQEQSV